MKGRAPCRIWTRLLFPQVEIAEQFLYKHEPLIMGFSYALAKSAQADRTITDADLISALMSMAKNQETLVNSGLHYETPLSSLSQQAVVREVHELLKGIGRRNKNISVSAGFMIPMCWARSSFSCAWAMPALPEGPSREPSWISSYPNFLRRKRRWLLRETPAPGSLFRNNKNRPRIHTDSHKNKIRESYPCSSVRSVASFFCLPLFVPAATHRAVPESFDRARDDAHPAQSRRAVPAQSGALEWQDEES